MSSYYPSFSYRSQNSFSDKGLIVTHFQSGDDGEVDTFLGMDPIYTTNAFGTMRHDYGAKYNNVATIKISVMKADGTAFSVVDVRNFLKWTTGSKNISYLDLVDYIDGQMYVVASFLGRITSVYQQKLDARTIGMVIEHTSVSPWAYSSIQNARIAITQDLAANDGIITSNANSLVLNESNNTLYSNANELSMSSNGILRIDTTSLSPMDNQSDDLDSYVFMDTTITNSTCESISIVNQTLFAESNGIDGVTTLHGMSANEVVKLSASQFIVSDKPGKVFGNNFNFVWPKLIPGQNYISVNGSGDCVVDFAYRYPIKIGDCAIDVDVNGGGCICDGYPGSPSSPNGPVTWADILDKPTTIQGYNITDAYTTTEVDNKINSISVNVDEVELNIMLQETLK